MAQRILTQLFCDLHTEGEEVEGIETITFAVEGKDYEVDVCDDHAEAFHDAFAPFVGQARRTSRANGRVVAAPSQRRSRSNGDGPDPKAVREWAKGQGLTVAARGRLSPEITQAYLAAQ